MTYFRVPAFVAALFFTFSCLFVSGASAKDARTYKSVRIINVSGEKIRFLIQANPGCAVVYKGRKNDPGHSFVCFQAALNDGDQKTYVPSGWIDAARFSTLAGKIGLGALVSLGAFAAGGPGLATAASVSYDVLSKKIAKGISVDDSAAPEGVMFLRVFPKGKVKVGFNQVRCIVPAGASTIYIGKSRRSGEFMRFTCSLLPPGTIFNGALKIRENRDMCLDLDPKRKRATLKKCIRKGKGRNKSWHRNQLVYLYGAKPEGGALRFVRHRRDFCLEATGKADIRAARCTKRGEARGDKQVWKALPNGQLVNAHWTKRMKKPVCLTTKSFRTRSGADLAVWPCDLAAARTPGALRWLAVTPGGNWGFQTEGGGSLRHRTVQMRPIYVRNVSGESVDLLFQYRPGCGRVVAGYTYSCFDRKNLKDNQGVLYRPDKRGFAAADWAKTIGISFVTSASSNLLKAVRAANESVSVAKEVGYGVLGSASDYKLAGVGVDLSYTFADNKKQELLKNALIPSKMMVLRVFPRGKMKNKFNQAICIVPTSGETIYIGRKKPDWSGRHSRFSCGTMPRGVTHAGKFRSSAGKCLTYDEPRGYAFVRPCKGPYTGWYHSQVNGSLRSDIKFDKRCLTAKSGREDVLTGACGKAGTPRNDFQRWVYTRAGELRNAGTKKCLSVLRNNRALLRDCKAKLGEANLVSRNWTPEAL